MENNELTSEIPVVEQAPIQSNPVPQPNVVNQQPMYSPVNNAIDPNKLMSSWSYVGYNLLFSIPLVGFILLIIFSFDDTKLNRRNYARSFFCTMLIWIAIIIIISVIIFGVLGLTLGGIGAMDGYAY